MPTLNPLPTHFPDGTKYVIEGRGRQVHRYIEYPDGRRIELPPREAQTCTCIEERKIAGSGQARKKSGEQVGTQGSLRVRASRSGPVHPRLQKATAD